ncbi:MAG: hypothetical protein MUO88_04155, partial [Desulfobacterales bacterium]|nr:hypothetical protein [Desulfobacterales bacterium]
QEMKMLTKEKRKQKRKCVNNQNNSQSYSGYVTPDYINVYSDDADPRSGHPDPLSVLTSFWHCQNGTV